MPIGQKKNNLRKRALIWHAKKIWDQNIILKKQVGENAFFERVRFYTLRKKCMIYIRI